MISIQSSSYGVSALVSSQMPAATRNGEANPAQTRTSGNAETGPTEGARPAGGPPPSDPPPGVSGVAGSTDASSMALSLLGADETEDSDAKEETTPGDFEAAARFLLDVIDLREVDETDDTSDNSGLSFDEAGTYRPAWIK
jgi:hypothetical protein